MHEKEEMNPYAPTDVPVPSESHWQFSIVESLSEFALILFAVSFVLVSYLAMALTVFWLLSLIDYWVAVVLGLTAALILGYVAGRRDASL